MQNLRYLESYELGRGNQSNSDIDLEEEPVICIFLVLDNRTDVLYITYWYFLIHDVLDLYLGYCCTLSRLNGLKFINLYFSLIYDSLSLALHLWINYMVMFSQH